MALLFFFGFGDADAEWWQKVFVYGSLAFYRASGGWFCYAFPFDGVVFVAHGCSYVMRGSRTVSALSGLGVCGFGRRVCASFCMSVVLGFRCLPGLCCGRLSVMARR